MTKFLFRYIVVGAAFLLLRIIFFPGSMREALTRLRGEIRENNTPEQAEIIFKMVLYGIFPTLVLAWPLAAFQLIRRKIYGFFKSPND